jgi:beta-lactamase superfamily II metal-dependent hydrolase
MHHGRRSLVIALLLGCGTPASSDDEGTDATSMDPSTSITTSATMTGATTSATSTTTASSTTTTGDPSTTDATTTSADDSTGDPPAGVLDIYWIDTEGGAATLFAMPEGPLLLVDAGFPGDRDADRIAAVVEDLGADAIDVFVVSHFHVDHVGGVPDLAERVPITAFWDHGDSVEQGNPNGLELWQDYIEVADGLRTIVEPDDVYDVGGVEITIVSAGTEVIDAPLPGGGIENPACDGASNMQPFNEENANSVGFVARFGAFELLDLGDLTWSYEAELACPMNRLGPIDLYQTTHHGLDISGATQLVHGIDPVVVVMNNGAHKGGHSATFDRIAGAPSQPDIWQQHRALDNDDAHNAPDDFIANFEDGGGDMGFAIHARVTADGTITLTNLRNAYTQQYASR